MEGRFVQRIGALFISRQNFSNDEIGRSKAKLLILKLVPVLVLGTVSYQAKKNWPKITGELKKWG